MRMKRTWAVLLVALLGIPAMATAAPTDLDLTIAKTQKHIYAYGDAVPAHEGRRMRLRLFHDDVLAGTKWDRLPSDGAYEESFDRPTSGSCSVQARLRLTSGKVFKEEATFECQIPEFSGGSAHITGTDVSQSYNVDIADDGTEQGYGLMYRRWLRADRGMLFLFEADSNASFYMKNTLIPLTIAFFDSTGRIVHITDMEPCEADPCPLYGSDEPYRGAIEVNQGTFEGAEGDMLSYFYETP